MLYFVYFGSYSGLIPFNEFNNYSLNIKFNSEGNFLWPENNAQLKARTMMLTVIYIAEPLFVLSIRRIDKSLIQSLKQDGHWFVYLMVFSMPVFHLIIMYIPAIQNLLTSLLSFRFDVIPLGPVDWLIAIIAGLLPILTLELAKTYARKRRIYF
jgi:magnesium-transporting ATPase (P-type)